MMTTHELYAPTSRPQPLSADTSATSGWAARLAARLPERTLAPAPRKEPEPIEPAPRWMRWFTGHCHR